jgi:hypothetical protein
LPTAEESTKLFFRPEIQSSGKNLPPRTFRFHQLIAVCLFRPVPD